MWACCGTLKPSGPPLAVAHAMAVGWFNVLPSEMNFFNKEANDSDIKNILSTHAAYYSKKSHMDAKLADPNYVPASALVKCNVDSMSKEAKTTQEYKRLVAQAATLQEAARNILKPSGIAAMNLEVDVLKIKKMKVICDALTTAAKGLAAYYLPHMSTSPLIQGIPRHHFIVANFFAMYKKDVEGTFDAPMHDIIECYETANDIKLPTIIYDNGGKFLEIVAKEKEAAIRLKKEKETVVKANNSTKGTKTGTPHRFYGNSSRASSTAHASSKQPLPPVHTDEQRRIISKNIEGLEEFDFSAPVEVNDNAAAAPVAAPAVVDLVAEEEENNSDEDSRFSQAEADAAVLNDVAEEEEEDLHPRTLFPKIGAFQGCLFDVGGGRSKGGYTPTTTIPTEVSVLQLQGGGNGVAEDDISVLALRGGNGGEDDEDDADESLLPAPLTLFRSTKSQNSMINATYGLALFFALAVARPIEVYLAQTEMNERGRRVLAATKMQKKEKKANDTMKLLSKETPLEFSLITAIVKGAVEEQLKKTPAASGQKRKAGVPNPSSSKKVNRGGAHPSSASSKKTTGTTKGGAGKGGNQRNSNKSSTVQRRGKQGKKQTNSNNWKKTSRRN